MVNRNVQNSVSGRVEWRRMQEVAGSNLTFFQEFICVVCLFVIFFHSENTSVLLYFTYKTIRFIQKIICL